uniref:Uncharacterized protein n=1 Tax=Acrobeloides nanus TaxID=290746 RepID=A0A914DT56_9BILA
MSNRILTMLQNRNAALNSPNSKLTSLYFEAMKKLAIDKGIPVKTTQTPIIVLSPMNRAEYARIVYDPKKFLQKQEKTGSELLCRRLRMC